MSIKGECIYCNDVTIPTRAAVQKKHVFPVLKMGAICASQEYYFGGNAVRGRAHTSVVFD